MPTMLQQVFQASNLLAGRYQQFQTHSFQDAQKSGNPYIMTGFNALVLLLRHADFHQHIRLLQTERASTLLDTGR